MIGLYKGRRFKHSHNEHTDTGDMTAAGTRFSWASYQIRKIAVCACAGNAGNVFPHRRFRRKPLVSDPGMHHGTCVTHVPWCMSGSLTCGGGENVPGIPGACAPAILRIWQEAHCDAREGLTPLYNPPSEVTYIVSRQNPRCPVMIDDAHLGGFNGIIPIYHVNKHLKPMNFQGNL